MGNIKIESIYPLTAMQQGIFFECKLNEGTKAYLIQNIFHMTGYINIDYMKITLELLSIKYDALRTRVMISKKENKPIQFVLKEQTIELREYDCGAILDDKVLLEVDRIAKEDIERGFDFIKDSLIRLKVVHVSETECDLILSAHHIIIDGWCSAIIMKEFLDFYNCLCEGNSRLKLISKVKRQKEKIAPFSEYVKWQMNQDKKAGLSYWKHYLEGYNEIAVIPSMKIAGAHKVQMAEHKICLDEGLTSALIRVSKECKVTISNVSEMIWGIVLMKYCGLDDVVFGKVVSGRNVDIKGIEEAVGIYVNIVCERIRIGSDSTFYTVLKQIAEDYYRGADYEYCSLAEVQACTDLKNRLIGSIFTFENFYGSDEALKNTEHCSLSLHSYREETNYEISVKVDLGNTLNFSILYNPNVYVEEEIVLIEKRIRLITKNIVSSIHQTICDMNLVDSVEKEQILREFNSEWHEFGDNETINTVFEDIAAENEEHTAVVCEEKSITYRALNEKANSLAHHLESLGVRQGNLIAVFTERKIETVIAFLAIQKLGGIYLPLDISQPERRIEMILEDAKPGIMLTMGSKANYRGKKLDICDEAIYRKGNKNPQNINTRDSYSYVIYTSGTTGKPKGVLLTHRGIVNLKYFFRNEFRVGCNDRVAQFANFVFDATIWEFSMALLTGASLHILSKKVIDNPALCEDYLKNNKISAITLPPLYCKQLDLPMMRLIITAGSASDEALISMVKDKGQYVNAYGPTEDTVCTTFYRHEDTESSVKCVPIGKPVLNHQVYLMQDNQLCPVGIPGELRICGCGVAQMYLNCEELTSQKFIDNPFGKGKMYCSGDLARWLPDGNIDFMGRIDKQVKIRGFRIELEEISSVLMSFNEINEAAAIVKANNAGSKYICAFYSSNEIVSPDYLKKELAAYLPDYMIPTVLVQINEIPVNTGGKVDTNKLQEIQFNGDQAKKGPETPNEEKVEKLICEILEEESVDIEGNFFEIGGESILAMTLLSMLEKEFSLKLSLQELYHCNSIRDLAAMMDSNLSEKKDSNLKQKISKLLEDEVKGLQIIERKDGYILLTDDENDDAFRHKIVKIISEKYTVPKYIFNTYSYEQLNFEQTSGTIETISEAILRNNKIPDELFNELTINMNSYRQKLLLAEENEKCELSLIQKLAYKIGIRSSCGFFAIDGVYDVSEIENAWKKVLEEQALLRSTIQYANGKGEIKEFAISDKWKLPYLDISYYSIEDKHKLIQKIKDIAEVYYSENMYQGDEVNHGALLLKMEESKFIFMLPCSHLIFDGFSNEILKNSITKYINNTTNIPVVQRYQECIYQFKQGLKKYTLEIVKEFEVAKFTKTVNSFAKHLKNLKMTSIEYRHHFSDVEMENIDKIRRQINEKLFAGIMDFVFPDMNVPVYVVQVGRYNKSLLECIGLFLDMVPVIYDASSKDKFLNNIQSRIEYIRKKELNAIVAVGKGIELKNENRMIQCPIIYNNLLIYEMEEVFETDTTSVEYTNRMVNIGMTHNELCINSMCVAGKEQEIKKVVQDIIKQILRENLGA